MDEIELNRFSELLSLFINKSIEISIVKKFDTDDHAILQDFISQNILKQFDFATADEVIESCHNILFSGRLNASDKKYI